MQHNVFGLYVTVKKVFVVHVFAPLEHLFHDGPNLALSKSFPELEQLVKRASVAKLHHIIKVVVGLDCLNFLNHISRDYLLGGKLLDAKLYFCFVDILGRLKLLQIGASDSDTAHCLAIAAALLLRVEDLCLTARAKLVEQHVFKSRV